MPVATIELVAVGRADGGVVLHGGQRAAPRGRGGRAPHALAHLRARRAQDHVAARLAALQHHLRVHQLDCTRSEHTLILPLTTSGP